MKYLLIGLLGLLSACTGSTEPEKDYQLVFGISNLPNLTGVLAGCTTDPLLTASGLLRIDSRKLGANPTGNCNLIALPGVPYDLKRSVRPSTSADKIALFVSIPNTGAAPKTGQVRAYDNQISNLLWTFPSSNNPLPAGQTDFCPTQLALSSSNTPIGSASEGFLVILDDPKDPKSTCTQDREAQMIVLNRNGTLKGWLKLSFAARGNGQIRIVASDNEIHLLYADTGTSYRVARLAISNLVNDTSTSSLQYSDTIGVFSSPNINLALEYSNTGLLLAIGGSNGKVVPVGFSNNKIEIGTELRETTETSDPIGASQNIFWNRETSNNNLTIFARERPDTLLRRTSGAISTRVTRGFETKGGIFTNDSSFWGINNNAFYRLDVFNYPNIQVLQNFSTLSDAKLSAISWLISN